MGGGYLAGKTSGPSLSISPPTTTTMNSASINQPNVSWKTVAAVLVGCTAMVAAFAFYAFFAREVTHWMEGEHHWFHDYEPWSLIGLICCFVMATALFLPAQPFVVAVGYLFGFHFLTIFFTYTVYTLAAFLMFNGARYWFRPMVEVWLREHRIVEGMAQYVKDPREGAKINLLFSFTPIAFCLHCYTMGITEIKEEIFMVTFLIGQSPHIFFGILTGSALLAAETSDITLDWMKVGMLVAGVGGTFLALVYLGNVAYDILGQLDEGCSNEKLLGSEQRRVKVRCGVGVTFDEADDRSIVVSAISLNSPAANSGVIRVGDVLHEVDGRNVHRADLDLVARLVPGTQGSNVELGFRREGEGGQLYLVLLQRSPGIMTYGAFDTPPPTPDELANSGREVKYQHADVVVHVHGNSSAVPGAQERMGGGRRRKAKL